jgi:hypothetical protein
LLLRRLVGRRRAEHALDHRLQQCVAGHDRVEAGVLEGAAEFPGFFLCFLLKF